MPKMPWTVCPYRTDTELHVLTSRLPLTRYRDVPRFLRWSMRIRKQLMSDPTCAGFTLDAHLVSKTFWTLSAWKDRESMMDFVRSGEHGAMLKDMAGRLGSSTFVESTAGQVDLPLEWATARQRIPD